MNLKLYALLYFLLHFANIKAQHGTLQVYCPEDVTVYVNEKYAGKSNTGMHGLLIEQVTVGEVKVSIFKNGYTSQTQTVIIKDNAVTEVTFELAKAPTNHQKYLGLDLNYGAFGLFNVNNVFTKAEYSMGLTPYFDYKLHRLFSIGGELMCMFGKPATQDPPRMMLSPNLRLNLLFNPLEKVEFNIMVASGYAFWPANTKDAYLTPTLNQTRNGWDFRTNAGVSYHVNSKLSLQFNFGYWASSSTSDNIVWITHDSMIIGLGPKLKF